MFEARLSQSGILKKIVEAIKDIVSSANLDFSPEGLSLQVSIEFIFKKKNCKTNKTGYGFITCFFGFVINTLRWV